MENAIVKIVEILFTLTAILVVTFVEKMISVMREQMVIIIVLLVETILSLSAQIVTLLVD